MLRRISGEGMQQDQNRGHRSRHMARLRAVLLRAVLGVACVAAGAGTAAVQAQTYGSDSGTVWSNIMKSIGMNRSSDADGIAYTERAPLVVPPTRDLPPPATEPPLAPQWPKDAVKRPRTPAKGKPAVVPATAVQTPNPVGVKKPWYDPYGIFNKEEYANFTGEPVRQTLTDPPSGYRIPSPTQPYGLGPEKKKEKKPTANDFNLGSVTPPSGSGGGY
jgi:hypothetical protein